LIVGSNNGMASGTVAQIV